VAGGTFFRTYEVADGGVTGEADPATVSGFRLDKYAVTVGRFRQFALAWNGGNRPQAASGKHTHLNGGRGLANSASPGAFEPGWIASDEDRVAPASPNPPCQEDGPTWTDVSGPNETLPMNCVNWYEALAFCIWDGGFLPSDAELEYAAAGGSQQREYPWGLADPGTANRYAIYGCYYPDGSGMCSGLSGIAPVGMAVQGAGRWGQLDLAGNMWEWALDCYDSYAVPCIDCSILTGDPPRVVRGGFFRDVAGLLLAANRDEYDATDRFEVVGFRCARKP
jgi:formylglycine-generating enzyme required for sulfatase activity